MTGPSLRDVLDARDHSGLADLLAEDPRLASTEMPPMRHHPLGAAPLNYLAMLRCDNELGIWKDVVGTGPIAELLIANGAPVDGSPGDTETPLMTAASYGDAEVARVLVEAGADLEATASPDAGGVPGGTALLHAAVFGTTEVLDVLVAAGASVDGPVLAAAAGDVTRHDVGELDEDERLRALVMAADHQRADVIDQLVAAGTPVDGVDATWSRHPLRVAAENGRPASVRRLLDHGADPSLTDAEGRTPLDLCRRGQAGYPGHRGHAEVEAILAPLTHR